MLTRTKYSGKAPLVVGAAVVAAVLMVLLPLAGCKNDSVAETPKYTVKFETAHGTAPASITVDSGAKLTAEQLKIEAEVGDNIFDGWYDGDTRAMGDKYTVTKDVTLVARWRDRGTVASVTFSPAAGSQVDHNGTVTLTSEEGATVRYTVNGGVEQTGASPVTVSVTGATTITAHATKEGLKPSAEATASYTVRQLASISVTPPTRTVYNVGDTFDSTGMAVTVTYDDGATRAVTGWTTDFMSVSSSHDINKTVTVSYTEGDVTKTATFTVDVASYQFTEAVQDVEPGYTGTMGEGTYRKFGDWPQTVKAAGVMVGEKKITRGGLDCYVGSDGNYYVKQKEKAYEEANYTYSDGSAVGQGGTTTKWFKVEPIVWRVLTADYKAPDGSSTGKALLLAESVLTGGIKWADSSNNYQNSNIRKWLNGNSGTDVQSDYVGGSGFLQSAFTAAAQALIAATSVDNSAASTNPDGSATLWNNGENQYASDTPTLDKVFLLSEKEATTTEYGFAEYSQYGQGDTRIRAATDYAKATGTPQSSTGGLWWLRSPNYNDDTFACNVINNGLAYNGGYVNDSNGGVVPALCVQLQQ